MRFIIAWADSEKKKKKLWEDILSVYFNPKKKKKNCQ